MKTLPLGIAAVLLFANNSLAQINDVGTVDGWLTPVRSLTAAGVKLHRWTTSQATLHNLDMSVYAAIDLPPLPAGYGYFGVTLWTESTFDTDPSSIELVLSTSGPNNVIGTRVIRDEGTVLFEDLGRSLSEDTGIGELSQGPGIFAGEDGITYMVLTSYPTNPPYDTRLLTLPGALPCLDCAGDIGMGITLSDVTPSAGCVSIFPNPAVDHFDAVIDLPTGTGNGRLLLIDQLGRIVFTTTVKGSGTIRVPLVGRANGNYIVELAADGRRLCSNQLSVAR